MSVLKRFCNDVIPIPQFASYLETAAKRAGARLSLRTMKQLMDDGKVFIQLEETHDSPRSAGVVFAKYHDLCGMNNPSLQTAVEISRRDVTTPFSEEVRAVVNRHVERALDALAADVLKKVYDPAYPG